MPKRGLKTLIIAAAVLLLHLGLLLFLRMNPPQIAEITAPLMAVEMVQLAPEPQHDPEPIPSPPEPVKPVEKTPPPVVEKAAISLPKVEKPKPRPVHDEKPKHPPKPQPQHEAQPVTAPKAPAVSKVPVASKAVTPPQFSAAYLNNPAPDYPRLSKKLREQGTVRLRVEVSASGLAASVAVSQSSGYPRLDEAAVAAVKRWKFIAAKQGDQPVAAQVIVPLVFALEG
ncbi:periplasmic protein TonB [Ewingella americana]